MFLCRSDLCIETARVRLQVDKHGVSSGRSGLDEFLANRVYIIHGIQKELFVTLILSKPHTSLNEMCVFRSIIDTY